MLFTLFPLYSCLNIIQAINTCLSLNSEYNISKCIAARASRLLSDAGSKKPLIFPTDVEELPAVASTCQAAGHDYILHDYEFFDDELELYFEGVWQTMPRGTDADVQVRLCV